MVMSESVFHKLHPYSSSLYVCCLWRVCQYSKFRAVALKLAITSVPIEHGTGIRLLHLVSFEYHPWSSDFLAVVIMISSFALSHHNSNNSQVPKIVKLIDFMQ